MVQKKLSYYLPILLLLFLSNSCKKSDKTSAVSEAKKIELTPSSFDFIGEGHNDGLDYVFENVFSGRPSAKYRGVKNASLKYVFEENACMKLSKDDKRQFETQEFKDIIKKATQSNSITLSSNNIMKDLTIGQENFIMKLNSELTNIRQTYEVIIRNIIELEKAAIKELREDEIVYALCVSSIAKHSIEYWNTSKGEKWFKHFNKQFKPIGTMTVGKISVEGMASGIDWHNVAVADVAAFGAGFPKGVTVGMVVGGLTAGAASAGTTAGLGAVLGGIVGGSATGLAYAIIASAGVLAAETVVSWFEDLF